MVEVDLLIRSGTIVDPARNVEAPGDVVILGNRIVVPPDGAVVRAARVIEAEGCLVTPGLIDHHAHVFGGGTALSVLPDLMLPMGVTTVVDAGSSGIDAFEVFRRVSVEGSRVRVLCQLNVSSAGQITEAHPESLDPAHFERRRIAALAARYPELIRGLKIRCGAEVVGRFGLEPLRAALEVAEEVGLPLVVHTTNPPCDMDELAAMLRPGDVLCHCFHGKGSTMINAEGHAKPKVREARARGVLFDTADARTNHSYPVIRAALADGFRPDIISTDLTISSLFGNMVFGLPVVLSRYLEHGMTLAEVVGAATAAPARALGLGGTLGTLGEGAAADVAVFALRERAIRMTNLAGEEMTVRHHLVPQMTVSGGEIVYRQVDFL
ncbi:MAG: amidohydrolase family protein [Rhodopila sp.]|nr:amidohydrolase family protein [Rhodopila sp.]